MQAGRELDALIADRVMGLKRTVRIKGTTNTTTIYSDNPYFDGGVSEDDMMKHYCLPLHYSTSIEAAWQVVEELVKRGKVFIVKGDGLRTGDHNPRWTVLCDNQPRVDADTAPLAICLAALKASGVEVA